MSLAVSCQVSQNWDWQLPVPRTGLAVASDLESFSSVLGGRQDWYISTSLCKKTGTYVPVLNDKRLVLKYQSSIKEDWYLSTSLDKSTGTYVPVANYDWYISTSRNLRKTGTMYQSLRQKAGT